MDIKAWYIKEFPTDELGAEINTITFEEIYEGMKNGKDFYNMLGVGDSVVRERVFDKLAELNNCSYDKIYNLWLGGD